MISFNFKNCKTVAEVKGALENNKYIFSDEERDLFVNSLVVTVNDAIEVAELLVRIKEANSKRQKNEKLLNDLEDEREKGNRGSKVYRVLNRDGLIRETSVRLAFLGRTDLPTDKDKINEKITELEKEIGEKRVEKATNDSLIIPIEKELKGLVEERDEAQRNYDKRESIVKVVSGGNPTIKYQGRNEELENIPITVNNYSIDTTSGTDGLLLDNPPILTGSARDILRIAGDFLDLLEDTSRTSIYHRTSLTGDYDQRVYQNKSEMYEG